MDEDGEIQKNKMGPEGNVILVSKKRSVSETSTINPGQSQISVSTNKKTKIEHNNNNTDSLDANSEATTKPDYYTLVYGPKVKCLIQN